MRGIPQKNTVEYIRWVQRIAMMTDVVSLNQKIRTSDGDDEVEIGDLIEDTFTHSPEELAAEQDRDEILAKYLDKYLSKQEQEIIRMRFGFDGDPMTLEDVGAHYGVTRERIRQIEKRALRKLRMQFSKHKVTKEIM